MIYDAMLFLLGITVLNMQLQSNINASLKENSGNTALTLIRESFQSGNFRANG